LESERPNNFEIVAGKATTPPASTANLRKRFLDIRGRGTAGVLMTATPRCKKNRFVFLVGL
jgi:hypothetical protein